MVAHDGGQTYEQLKVAMERGGADQQHGALLAMVALLEHGGTFMTPRFDACVEAVLRVAPTRLLRLEMIGTLPKLAAFVPDAFARCFLRPALGHLTRAVVWSRRHFQFP